MKILIVNGSPRGARGNTARMTQPVIEGAREAGAEVEEVYLHRKHIEHCTGCLSCWVRTPGVCVHRDDMPALLLKMRQCDLLVYAMPLYVFTVPGLMKDFMDRFIPLIEPFIIERNGLCTHPSRYPNEGPKAVMVLANCGFAETAHFSGMKETFRQFFQVADYHCAGMICTAAGGALGAPNIEEMLPEYFAALRQAGREVAQGQNIAPETLAILDRPLVPDAAMYAAMANQTWRSYGIEPLNPLPGESADQRQPVP